MFPGLLVAFVVGAPPADPPSIRLPGAAESHKDAVAKFGAAVWNMRRERLLTAARQLESATKQDPEATAPLRELVKIYSQIGREPDAIRVAKEILAKDPHDGDIAHLLARLLFDAGDLKGAVAAAKLASEVEFSIARSDKAVAVYRDLATLCEKANDPAAAESAIRKAVELLVDQRKNVITAAVFTPKEADTAAAECLERLGKIQTKQRKYSEAVKSFEAAAKLYADSRVNDPASAARLGWNLSGVYQSKGDPATALTHLRSFLKLKPISPESYTRLVRLLRDSGKESSIETELGSYFERDPKNLTIQVVLAAEKARGAGSRSEADRMFGAIMSATNDPKIVEVVVRSHLEQGRAEQIIAELDRCFSLLKDEGKEEKPVTVESMSRRTFAAEKARVIGDILRDDPEASLAVLRAAAAGLQAGTKRTHQVYYFIGQLAARHGELGLAALQFQEAVRRAPRETQGDSYQSLVEVLRKARKPDQVVRVCRDGLQNAPDIAPVFFNYFLASALAELGDAEGALAAVDKAIDQTGESDRLTVRLQKVHVLSLLGKWDDAIALGKKLLEEFDSSTDRSRVRYALGGAYWDAKKSDEAEAELRAILDVDPEHAAACNDLGFHLADQSRNLDEAERLVRTAIRVDKYDRKKSGSAEPENASYLDSLGWVLFRKGKLPEARAELERATALHDGSLDPLIWDHLGDVLFRMGEKPKAKAAWEKAEKLYEGETRNSSRGHFVERLEELKRKLKRVQ